MTMHVATVYVENQTGDTITNIQFSHRYDSDVFNFGALPVLGNTETEHIGAATFWTGFLRTGVDYWWIAFNRLGVNYTCKASFYCYLTSDDADGNVTLRLNKNLMTVVPPKSSQCPVKIYAESALMEMITADHVASGPAPANQPEDPSKKCLCC